MASLYPAACSGDQGASFICGDILKLVSTRVILTVAMYECIAGRMPVQWQEDMAGSS
jgi:hypothetical protein